MSIIAWRMRVQHELITLENKKNSELVVIMTKEGGDDTLDRIVSQIALDANSLVFDSNTKKGLDSIKTNAYSVKQKKAAILKAGKDLTRDLKAIPNLIIDSMKQVESELDYTYDMVRMPLTHHEALIENKKRDDDKEAEQLAEIARVEAERIENERLFALLLDEAHIMNDRFDIDKEKAEIAKAKQAEQEAKDRAAREAEEADRQKKMIEVACEQARKQAEQKHKDALEKAEREKLEAEQREKQLLIDAENARVAAAEKATRDQLQAVEDERKSVEAEAAKQKAVDDARNADKEHRGNIMRDVKERLMLECSLDETTAKAIVHAVLAMRLGALKIEF